MNLEPWREEYARMRVQSLISMRPTERAVFAVAAAAYHDALARERTAEAVRLAAEFAWLLEAALSLQEAA